MQTDLLLGDLGNQIEIPHSENADVEYYTTYPKTSEKSTGNPNFWLRMHSREPLRCQVISGQNTRKKQRETRLRMRAPKRTPSGSSERCSRVPTFCTTTIVRKQKNAGKISACALEHFWSGPLTVTSLPLASPPHCDFVATYILLTSLGLLFSH